MKSVSKYMKLQIRFINRFEPSLVHDLNWGVCGSGHWGFTPLWALAFDLWEFSRNEEVKQAAIIAHQLGPTSAIGSLNPKLIVCREAKSFDETSMLAKAVAQDAKALDLECLVIDTFRHVRGRMKIQVVQDLLPPFIEISRSCSLRSLLVFVNEKSDLNLLNEMADEALSEATRIQGGEDLRIRGSQSQP
jgi:hypothetical protein